ncbi:MAG: DUF3560 domain-containing protein, partial [Reyranella sp.]
LFDRAHMLAQQIPLGQPILIGHHSERGHRRHIAKIEAAGFGGVAASKMADKHHQAASGIEDQLERSIFDDDADAVERLEERIAELEAKREKYKAFNRDQKKAGQPILPAYVLSNLGANIRRYQARLKAAQQRAAGTAPRSLRLLMVKYAGECATCGTPIARGASALYDKAERALYCYDAAAPRKCADAQEGD